jgi:shikimate kinase
MKHKSNNIFLIGPMGSGKSTTGRLIAKLAELDFYDADQEIEHRSGVAISWIFECEGEAGFRKREQDMIKALTQLDNIVLATGGGSVIRPENCEYLQNYGVVFYLKVSADVQFARISAKKSKRPIFVAHDSQEKLKELNAVREPLYQKIADFIYDTDHSTPLRLAQEIVNDWKQYKETIK